MIKLIIFDWDDVVVLGAKEAYFSCYHHTLSELGVHLSPDEERQRILSKWSKPHQEELKVLLAEHPELLSQAITIYETKKNDIFVSSLRMLPGVPELIYSLSKQYILAVSSGNTIHMIKDIIMPHFRIPNLFSQIVSSHDITDPEKMKPHPYMLDVIIKKEKVKKEETLYVGDALTDVLMAQAAGVDAIVVLTGHLSEREAQEAHATHIIPDITHLPSILQNHYKD